MALVHKKTNAIRTQLDKLGLSIEILSETIRRSELRRRQFSGLHPRIVAGIVCWGEKIAALRDMLSPAGWIYDESGGLPKVISPDGKVAIGALSGDECTGNSSKDPRSRYKRGSQTVQLVYNNRQQLAWSDRELGIEPTSLEARKFQMWVLVTYSDGDLVRAEVSMPTFIGDNGHVEDFSERIILPVVNLSDDLPPPNKVQFTDDPIVDVRRKS
ncbi:MAG: hypothetical protein AB7G93_15290 [Bdellovibrionales bacterium]